MPHLSSFNNAMKITWVKRYLDEENESKWKLFFRLSLKNVGGDFFFKWNISPKHLPINKDIDPFWNDVLIAWSHYKYYNPVKFKEIISQPIWFNSHILIGDKPIFVKMLFEANMIYTFMIILL